MGARCKIGCELLEAVCVTAIARNQRRELVMGHVLCEPVELTECELDAVAGGAFNINVTAIASDVDARIRASIRTSSENTIKQSVESVGSGSATALIDNSVNSL